MKNYITFNELEHDNEEVERMKLFEEDIEKSKDFMRLHSNGRDLTGEQLNYFYNKGKQDFLDDIISIGAYFYKLGYTDAMKDK